MKKNYISEDELEKDDFIEDESCEFEMMKLRNIHLAIKVNNK